MPIITLMDRVKKKYADQPHPFINKNLALRRSYLTGVAMQAHADGVVNDEEQRLFLKIAEAFGISTAMATEILARALHCSEETVLEIRENLIESKYKYYFILDLQIMAHQDAVVKPVELKVIERFSELLEIEGDDLSFLKELASALVEKDPSAKERWVSGFFDKMRVDPTSDSADFMYYASDENFNK